MSRIRITKQFEGGQLKCGNYWKDVQYGPIRLHLEEQTGGEDVQPTEGESGFDFGQATRPTETASSTENIRRVFLLSRDDLDGEPPRKVVQIQCTAWPDFDVPKTPQVLLNLMREVDAASDEQCVEDDEDLADQPPILVHCE